MQQKDFFCSALTLICTSNIQLWSPISTRITEDTVLERNNILKKVFGEKSILQRQLMLKQKKPQLTLLKNVIQKLNPSAFHLAETLYSADRNNKYGKIFLFISAEIKNDGFISPAKLTENCWTINDLEKSIIYMYYISKLKQDHCKIQVFYRVLEVLIENDDYLLLKSYLDELTDQNI